MKRTWPIATDRGILNARWSMFAESQSKRELFRETRDRKVTSRYSSLDEPGRKQPPLSAIIGGDPMPPVSRYGSRSFDRHWVIKDARLGDFMRPVLWQVHGERQVYLTSLLTDTLGDGPAATVTAEVPDLHHFSGRGGKDVIPLWRDKVASRPNVVTGLLDILSDAYDMQVGAEDLFAYAYAVLAAVSYVELFRDELTGDCPRVPITRDPSLFRQGAAIGRSLVHLHTYGERLSSSGTEPKGRAKLVLPIPTTEANYPASFSYDGESATLRVGDGEIWPVASEVWSFSISGLEAIHSWLGYRMLNPSGRSSSPLDSIGPRTWPIEFTQELLSLLWTLEATIEVQPELERFLLAVSSSPTIPASELPEPSVAERQPPESGRNLAQLSLV